MHFSFSEPLTPSAEPSLRYTACALSYQTGSAWLTSVCNIGNKPQKVTHDSCLAHFHYPYSSSHYFLYNLQTKIYIYNFSTCIVSFTFSGFLANVTVYTGVLISPQPDQEGNKLQRQNILMFIYPIYNYNCRNIITIYIYNKTSIKRNILTIKQNTEVLISPQPDQEGNKLQRQNILKPIYPIYNHNCRNISTIYIYNKISIKRNILTIKQNRVVLISPQPDQEENKLQLQNIYQYCLYIYITRLASKEIFSPSNKIHREVGRPKDLSTPLTISCTCTEVQCAERLLLLLYKLWGTQWVRDFSCYRVQSTLVQTTSFVYRDGRGGWRTIFMGRNINFKKNK